jgi:hypothetical protein
MVKVLQDFFKDRSFYRGILKRNDVFWKLKGILFFFKMEYGQGNFYLPCIPLLGKRGSSSAGPLQKVVSDEISRE